MCLSLGAIELSWIETALIQKVHEINSGMKFTITEPTFWRHKDRKPGDVIDDVIGPYRHAPGAGGLVHTRQFEELVEQMDNPLVARLKAKALQARGIAPKVAADFERDLDDLIAEGPKLNEERVQAVGLHKEVVAGVRGEFGGLREAMNILSNGGPPLAESEKKLA